MARALVDGVLRNDIVADRLNSMTAAGLLPDFGEVLCIVIDIRFHVHGPLAARLNPIDEDYLSRWNSTTWLCVLDSESRCAFPMVCASSQALAPAETQPPWRRDGGPRT
ncbi:hypothetical protein BJX61DRAFT_499922 [Aspergillus egyptiacus]|nr:hypothetical protein BJX61DRAFT_499922 [Aspergillus egyptiacus]